VSYLLNIPPLGPDGAIDDHVTVEDFQPRARAVLDDYLASWAVEGQREATRLAVLKAISAAYDLAEVDIVGPTFRVMIAGHANPHVSTAPPVDSVTVSLYAVPTPKPASGG